jgi:hypothetical protein
VQTDAQLAYYADNGTGNQVTFVHAFIHLHLLASNPQPVLESAVAVPVFLK